MPAVESEDPKCDRTRDTINLEGSGAQRAHSQDSAIAADETKSDISLSPVDRAVPRWKRRPSLPTCAHEDRKAHSRHIKHATLSSSS